MSNQPDDDIAARLNQVNDDQTPLDECRVWLEEQMHMGRDPDELLGELLAGGWAADDVEPLVDAARKRTKGVRSVLGARAEVSRQFNTKTGTTKSIAASLISAVANKVGEESRDVRSRISRGLCHQCGHDVKGDFDRCPQCGAVVIRRQV